MRMANFFWGFQEQQARIHLLGWDHLCQALNEGGLQLHHLELFNLALLGKHIWRIIHDESSLVSRVMTKKYLVDDQSIQLSTTYNSSRLWKQIVKNCGFVTDNITWQVGPNSSLPLNNRLWWPVQQSGLVHDSFTVSDLILRPHNRWNFPLIRSLYPLEVLNEFKRSPLPLLPVRDTLRCTMGNSGDYSVKDGYQYLVKSTTQTQNVNNQMSQSSTTSNCLFSELWKVDIRPTTKLFLWKCIKGIIPTTSFLKRRHVPLRETCCFCTSENESMDHLFIHCSFARACWFGSFLTIRTDAYIHRNLQDWIKYWLSLHKMVSDHVFYFPFKLLESIWYARNQTCFAGKSFLPSDIIKAAITQTNAEIARVGMKNSRELVPKQTMTDDTTQMQRILPISNICQIFSEYWAIHFKFSKMNVSTRKIQISIQFGVETFINWCFKPEVRIGHLQMQLTCLRDALGFLLQQSQIQSPTNYPLLLCLPKKGHIKIIVHNHRISWKFDFLLKEIKTFMNMFVCYYFVN